MLSKQVILKQLEVQLPTLRKYGVAQIGLFGSFVRNSHRMDSDIDILVDFENEENTFDNYIAVSDLLENVFEGRKIDLVTKGGSSPYIGPHILADIEYV
jgi:uncharacterized protein